MQIQTKKEILLHLFHTYLLFLIVIVLNLIVHVYQTLFYLRMIQTLRALLVLTCLLLLWAWSSNCWSLLLILVCVFPCSTTWASISECCNDNLSALLPNSMLSWRRRLTSTLKKKWWSNYHFLMIDWLVNTGVFFVFFVLFFLFFPKTDILIMREGVSVMTDI